MTTLTPTPLGAPAPVATPDTGTVVPTAIPWCECDNGCALTMEFIAFRYEAYAGAGKRVPHPVVVRVTQDIWDLVAVCRFFELAVEDAAVKVAGAVQKDYSVEQAHRISAVFSERWLGCPECAFDA